MGQPKEFIDITDFSPGIFADLHGFSGATATANPNNVTSNGPQQVNGAAVVDDTFGCNTDDTGALIPLPLAVTVTQASWDVFGSGGAPLFWPTGKVGYYILDVQIMSFIVTDDHDATTERDAAFVLFGGFFDPDGASGYRQLVWGVIIGLDIDMWKVVHWDRYAPSIDPSPATSIPSGCVALMRHIDGTRDSDGFIDYGIYAVQNSVFFMLSPSRDGSVGDDNTNWASGAIPADELALTSYGTDTGRSDYPEGIDHSVDDFSGCIGVFPDPLDLNSFYPRYIGGRIALPGYMAISHQGRAAMASLLSRGFGAGFNWVLDRIAFSPIYNASLAADVATPATTQFPSDYTSSIAGDENVNPIGTLGTIMAAELLVVKHGDGGVLMRGDMDNFEAVALPYIESTYGVVSMGVSTPIGFIYGSKNGVFVWSGGQTSEKLSQQIDTFFWEHAPTIIYTGNSARFGYWNPWIMVPNDFMFNTMAKSWWKIEDSPNHVTYSHYDTSSLNGKMYAFAHLNAPGTVPKIFAYDPDVLRSTYSWKSQPLIETRERRLSFEDIKIWVTTAYPWTASPQTVVVTLTGFDEDGVQISSPSITFTLNATSSAYGSQVILKQIASTDGTQATFTARYVQVKVVVTAASGPAAKVHAIRFGVTERTRQPVDQT